MINSRSRYWPVHTGLRGELHCPLRHLRVVLPTRAKLGWQEKVPVQEAASPAPSTSPLARLGTSHSAEIQHGYQQLKQSYIELKIRPYSASSLEIWQVVCSSVAALGAAVFCCRFVCNYQLFLLWPRTFHINAKLSPQPRVGPSIIHILHTVGQMLILHPAWRTESGRGKSPVSAAALKFHAWTKYRIPASLQLRLRLRLRNFKFEQFEFSSCCCIYWGGRNQTISFVWPGQRDSSL